MKNKAMFFLCFFITGIINGQETEKKLYIANQVNGYDITIDGKLDETAWQSVQWEDHFTQFQPHEGRSPHQQTEFALLYDEHNIYVAIKALDKNPDSITMRLTRRDVMDGDQVGIAFDTYLDRRTAFLFAVSAVGVKADWVISNDGENEDFTWDPIWWVKTSKTEYGWIAEMRIPLTQLRFDKDGEQMWGLQVFRQVFRKEELSVWQPMKRSVSGFVSSLEI
ncbi:MAG: carbohydrate binding family 9 domain-containing protein [Mariniphaga sp.]|nr:carbohydrate binding family 9 domain-containing protein [Mariniphaga sp.]